MSKYEILATVLSIAAFLISFGALVWTIISYRKTKNHEFYSLINNKLKSLCFIDLPNALYLFVDLESKIINQDKYDDVSDIIVQLSKVISPMRFFDVLSYNKLIDAVTAFDDICIAVANKNKISDADYKLFINKLNELFESVKGFYSKH